MRRVRKRSNRPLLQTADPEATLRRLLEERSPVYAMADMTVESRDGPHDWSSRRSWRRCATRAPQRRRSGRQPPARAAKSRSRLARALTRL